jgi:hypothetical protein
MNFEVLRNDQRRFAIEKTARTEWRALPNKTKRIRTGRAGSPVHAAWNR